MTNSDKLGGPADCRAAALHRSQMLDLNFCGNVTLADLQRKNR